MTYRLVYWPGYRDKRERERAINAKQTTQPGQPTARGNSIVFKDAEPWPPVVFCVTHFMQFSDAFHDQNKTNNNNNNNNNRIYISPYGPNFRCAGDSSDQCSVKA